MWDQELPHSCGIWFSQIIQVRRMEDCVKGERLAWFGLVEVEISRSSCRSPLEPVTLLQGRKANQNREAEWTAKMRRPTCTFWESESSGNEDKWGGEFYWVSTSAGNASIWDIVGKGMTDYLSRLCNGAGQIQMSFRIHLFCTVTSLSLIPLTHFLGNFPWTFSLQIALFLSATPIPYILLCTSPNFVGYIYFYCSYQVEFSNCFLFCHFCQTGNLPGLG